MGMTIFIIVGVLALAALTATIIINKLIHVCQPNEVLVFSGTKRRVGNRVVGYKLVQGGRGVRMPLLEKVHRMDLTNMVIDLSVQGAYCKGGIPLNVEGVANVKIASDEPTIGNAIERFLGKSRSEIIVIAKETLEGNLRGVLATLTPEEVNEDRVKFAQNLLHEADHDLKRLGIVLDTLKIQHVSDDKGYLDSLGRKQTAELLMRSRIAEAENRALARTRAAENLQEKEMARIEAQMKLAHAEAERRVADAQTKREAMIAEHRGIVQAQIARAHGEVNVQRQRIDQVRLQLEADEVKKAEAQRTAMVDRARGASASIVEEGKAQARALEQLSESWKNAGDDAARIFIAQKMNKLIATMLAGAQAPVQKMTVIDGRLGGGDNLAAKAMVASEQIKETLGIDVPELVKGLGKKRRPSPPPLPARG